MNLEKEKKAVIDRFKKILYGDPEIMVGIEYVGENQSEQGFRRKEDVIELIFNKKDGQQESIVLKQCGVEDYGGPTQRFYDGEKTAIQFAKIIAKNGFPGHVSLTRIDRIEPSLQSSKEVVIKNASLFNIQPKAGKRNDRLRRSCRICVGGRPCTISRICKLVD